MLNPAQQYLTLRSLGAPAVLLSLAMQGVFRGFKDTKTPLYATVAGDVTNIILDLIFMFVLRLGVSGAAIAHVISQLPIVNKGYGCYILYHPVSVDGCQTGIDIHGCISSMLAGLILAVILGGGLSFGAKIFTKDVDVLLLIGTGIPFVAATQPINSLAFVFDGVNFGASDFAYSALSLASSCSDCQHYMPMHLLQKSRIHRTLDSSDDIYESSSVCWVLEDRNRNRALEVSEGHHVTWDVKVRHN
ncbi:armadillo/beta-catenin repeat family protein [Hibiscus syriacus]|uniref:Armadillo/beta-catenin repeat family protein n=1 Tax=Hibiscus syriacus TaxID=106335 RepID=A0A6A3AS60_HIBSY|nr:armadillo/beta-catenin repeat family protein [Hibiscus syriacus]